MKNLVISLLSTKIIMGMSFWTFDDVIEVALIGFTIAFAMFCLLETLDDVVSRHRRKKRMQRSRANRFKMEVIDLTERESV